MDVKDIVKGKFSFEWLLIAMLLGTLFYATWRFRYKEGITGTINFIQMINQKDKLITDLQQKLDRAQKGTMQLPPTKEK